MLHVDCFLNQLVCLTNEELVFQIQAIMYLEDFKTLKSDFCGIVKHNYNVLHIIIKA